MKMTGRQHHAILFTLFSISHGYLRSVVAQTRPAPTAVKSGAYYTGHYRDLFKEDGHTQLEIDRKVQAAYRQLFQGDPVSERIYFGAGRNDEGPLAYILNPGDEQDVRSEGMSYGMMIAVQLGHKAEFDALWNWARTYMYIGDPNHPSFGYYAWACKKTGEQNSDTPAPDGEEYFAMSLYFASARWGDGEGIYNYHAHADRILRTVLHRKQVVGRTSFGDRNVGPEFSEVQHMVTFLAEPSGAAFTDPSYHLPGFYELWARWGPLEDRSFWAAAARTSRALFMKTTDSKTGLSPVYANFDGSPHATDFAESAVFGHDAWRVASNWSWDASWFASGSDERVLSDRLQAFFASEGASYGQVFTLSGRAIDVRPADGLIAANAVTSLAASSGRRAKDFTEALWTAPVPTGKWRYYDGMLYMLSLLHVSGEFRIWKPQWAAPQRKHRSS